MNTSEYNRTYQVIYYSKGNTFIDTFYYEELNITSLVAKVCDVLECGALRMAHKAVIRRMIDNVPSTGTMTIEKGVDG